MQAKYFKRLFGVFCLLAGLGMAQQPGVEPAAAPKAKAASQEVLVSAREAVAKLCADVTRGDFSVTIDRMNPQWLRRLAAQTEGGEAALRKKFAEAPKLMAKNGMAIISSQPSVPANLLQSYEVGIGKTTVKRKGDDGVERLVEEQVYTQWMVLVPTVTRFRLPVANEIKPALIEKTTYQVAVADKGKDNWTFIDGSNLTLSSLRRLFLTLPKDMELPPVSEREIK